jgi:hypothetical protein
MPVHYCAPALQSLLIEFSYCVPLFVVIYQAFLARFPVGTTINQLIA